MAFRDYSTTPASNTTLGDGTYVGPNMLRNKVRPAFQQIMADGKELADEVELLQSALAAPTNPDQTFRTKGEAVALIDSFDEGAFIHVFVDDTKNSTWAVYQKVGSSLEYLFSVAPTSDELPVVDGVLFDTAGADNFTDLIYTANADLTVTYAEAAFSDASAVDRVMTVPASDGVTPLYFCFDNWTIDATFTVTSFPSAGVDGVYISGRYYVPGSSDADWGIRIAAHGGAATTAQITAMSGSQILEATHTEAGLPKTIRIRYAHDLETDIATHTANINGGADIQLTETYPASPSGAAHPTLKLAPTIRFKQGVLTCTAFKFSAGYPNARFAFIGDSLTIWPDTGFSHLIRADYPDEVLIAGASGTTTGDWLDMVESVTRMLPRYAFICLGTNDFIGSVPLATMEANMTSILADLRTADIVPIVISAPPIGYANVPTFNTWLDAQSVRYIDIYTTLVGTGTSLSASYDSGDGIHWNAAGHIAVKAIIADYITDQGL